MCTIGCCLGKGTPNWRCSDSELRCDQMWWFQMVSCGYCFRVCRVWYISIQGHFGQDGLLSWDESKIKLNLKKVDMPGSALGFTCRHRKCQLDFQSWCIWCILHNPMQFWDGTKHFKVFHINDSQLIWFCNDALSCPQNIGIGPFLEPTWCRASLVFVDIVFGCFWSALLVAFSARPWRNHVFDKFRWLRPSLTCSFFLGGSFSINFGRWIGSGDRRVDLCWRYCAASLGFLC